MSPFDPSGLGAEESLGLLDDYLEVAKHLRPHGFPGDKAAAGSSEWLAVDGAGIASDFGKGAGRGCRVGAPGAGGGLRCAPPEAGAACGVTARLVLQRMPSPGRIGC